MERELGISFGNYTLLRRIAQGGMAEVFIARHEGMQGIDRLVAIKRILPHLLDDISFVRMFQNEAKLAARLSHPSIIHIYDFGKVEEHFFIAMEFIEGVHTGQLIQRAAQTPMPPALVARIGIDACAGLHYAHQRTDDDGQPLQLVHRDVSPPNLLVSYDGNLKLLDFGIAKAVNTIEQTRSGIVKGKFAYMSPEQTMGKSLDGRSDVFSLGIVMWELLTGRGAVTRDDQILAMQTIRDGKVPPVESVRNDVPKPLALALRRALQKSPNKRPDAHEFGADLEKYLKRSNEPSSPADLGNWLRHSIPQVPLFEDNAHASVGTEQAQIAAEPMSGPGIAELGDAQRIVFAQPGAEPDYQDFEQRPRDTSGVLPLHRPRTEALVGDDNTVVVAMQSSPASQQTFNFQSNDDNTLVAEMQNPVLNMPEPVSRSASSENTIVAQMPMADIAESVPRSASSEKTIVAQMQRPVADMAQRPPRAASNDDNSVTRVMDHPLSMEERAQPELITSPGQRPSQDPYSQDSLPTDDQLDTLIAPGHQLSPPDNSLLDDQLDTVIAQAPIILTPAPAPIATQAPVAARAPQLARGATAAVHLPNHGYPLPKAVTGNPPGNSRLYLVALFLLLVLVGIAAFAYDQGLLESTTTTPDAMLPSLPDGAHGSAEPDPTNPPRTPVVSPLVEPIEPKADGVATKPPDKRSDAGVGQLTLTCNPKAVVFHGRKKLGVTPLKNLSLKSGTYRLRFKAPRRKRTYREVIIRPGKSTVLNVRLSRR